MPGMITTRSSLPESLTAGWISVYLHIANSFLLTASSDRADFLLNGIVWVGRGVTPARRACAISVRRSDIESGPQTTRVVPGLVLSSAEASERPFGTAPPAGGVTEASGRG